ncbi:hypothetical protein BK025_12220 [Sodalis sp. TME1]|nr:hypothetical protein BK025_12220 [Sodalis sp. TME1]
MLAQLNGGKSAIVGLRRRKSGLFASRSEILLRCTRRQSKIRPQRQSLTGRPRRRICPKKWRVTVFFLHFILFVNFK